jgi:rubrerythrin
MAKDKQPKEEEIREKEHKRMHEVYKSGDRYHCGECGAELELGKDCPTCKASFDWGKITGQTRYL